MSKVYLSRPEDLSKAFCIYRGSRSRTQTSTIDRERFTPMIDTEVDIIKASVFNDVLEDTNSPARALQTQLTSLIRMAYYSWLPLFDAKAEVTAASFVTPLAPVSS